MVQIGLYFAEGHKIINIGILPCKVIIPITGISCQIDIDGCADNPCENNCTDLTPAQAATSNFSRGYLCECSVGFEMVEDICIS